MGEPASSFLALVLFWLSLVPFVTGWMGENHFAPLPTAVYGINLLACAIAYTILQTLIIAEHEANSNLEAAIGNDLIGKISILCYVLESVWRSSINGFPTRCMFLSR